MKEYDITVHYYSEHITRRLQEMLRANTTVIEAPLGYGKTTAVRDYLERNLADDVPVYWFTAFDEAPQSAWRRLCGLIRQIDPRAGETLIKLGFPTIFTVGDIAETIRNISCSRYTVLVIDNFQLLQRHLPDDVLLSLLHHGGSELHLIVITQILAKNALAAFYGADFLTIDEQDLRLTSADIQAYYQRAGVVISEEQARQIEQYTEGWIVAVYLQLLSYIETGAFSAPASIKTLMEKLVWERLDVREQEFLLRISPFKNVTRKQICFLLGVPSLPEFVEQLPNKVAMIRFLSDKGCFHIHHILSEFLKNGWKRPATTLNGNVT